MDPLQTLFDWCYFLNLRLSVRRFTASPTTPSNLCRTSSTQKSTVPQTIPYPSFRTGNSASLFDEHSFLNRSSRWYLQKEERPSQAGISTVNIRRRYASFFPPFTSNLICFSLLLSSQALDFLCIAVHELASISERRVERLCNPSLSELPAFLVNEGGLNSGFMIAHCTAAALGSYSQHLWGFHVRPLTLIARIFQHFFSF